MSNGYSGIRFERLGAVLRVTIDNPRSELNTVDAEMHGELARLLELREGKRGRSC